MRGLARRIFTTGRNTRDLQVFLMFLGHDVHGVVNGDDTQDMTILIANRNSGEVVLGHLLGHFLLVAVRLDIDHIAIGKVTQKLIRLGDHQSAH